MRFKVDDRPYYWSSFFKVPQQICIWRIEGDYYISEWGLYYTDDQLYVTKEEAVKANSDKQ
jgi:hypothetical protein